MNADDSDRFGVLRPGSAESVVGESLLFWMKSSGAWKVHSKDGRSVSIADRGGTIHVMGLENMLASSIGSLLHRQRL